VFVYCHDMMQHLIVTIAISLVDWCTVNKSGRIRVRIIQELVRIFADLHQNRIAKGLSFLGAVTCKLT